MGAMYDPIAKPQYIVITEDPRYHGSRNISNPIPSAELAAHLVAEWKKKGLRAYYCLTTETPTGYSGTHESPRTRP